MSIKRRIAILMVSVLALTMLTACASDTRPSSSSSSSSETSTSSESSQSTNQSDTTEGLWALGIDTVTLDDQPVTETAFKDNDLTVLNIWATWCPPCVSELPHLQEVSERFADKKVQIVGVLEDGTDTSGNKDAEVIKSAQTLLSEAGASYTVILPDKTLRTEYINSMQYFPTTFFIDSEGNVVEEVSGARDADDWEELINEVLASISK